jgi:hypothetical protein
MPGPYIWDEPIDPLPNKTLFINQAVEHIKDWIKREPDGKVDGTFEKRIDINDVKHRFALTKSVYIFLTGGLIPYNDDRKHAIR